MRKRWRALAPTCEAGVLFAGLAVAHWFCFAAMKSPRLISGFLASVIASFLFAPCASAQLPVLQEKDFLGYFAVFANKRYQFGITSDGKVVFAPITQKGDLASERLRPRVDILVQEIMPSGKAVTKQILPESLQSPQAATNKLVKTLIRGKVTGDAAFEVNIEQDRGIVTMGGRVTEPGTLKNPLRLSLKVSFPNAYPEKTRDANKDEKAFDKLLEQDRIELKWTDGKRVKQSFEEPVDASSKKFNGPGIVAMEAVIGSTKDRKFLLAARENSVMALANNGSAKLYMGFNLLWTPDAEKDKSGKARLSFEVK
jgi:hypothetical protein